MRAQPMSETDGGQATIGAPPGTDGMSKLIASGRARANLPSSGVDVHSRTDPCRAVQACGDQEIRCGHISLAIRY
jgi:hypothetical protein